jgi:phenylacetate-CoA ligase
MAFSALPHSTLENILWPAIPGPTAARLMAMLFQLEQTQWWSPAELLTQQLRQLQSLVLHAYYSVPFYRQRLEQIGFEPLQPLTLERWRTLPLLTRTDIQSAGDALRSQLLPGSHGQLFTKETSGSTGQPLKVYGTELNEFLWMAFTLREHLWHHRDFRQKLAIIRFGSAKTGIGDPPQGLVTNSWQAPVCLLYPTGPSATLNINTDISIQAAWLQQHNPDYLLTYPSNLLALANYCQAKGISLPNLKEVRTISEMVTPQLRTLCQHALGAKLVDAYSSQEVGYLAFECPTGEPYHIQSENVLVEILDEAGQPCPPGTPGRVIVTSLHNYAMPLLRYEIRDYAIPGESCACGRGLPTLTRILGRRRNLLTLPNGEQRWPTGFLKWAQVAPIRQFQIVQKSLEQIEARLVTQRPLTLAEESHLTAILHQTYGYPFQLTFTYLDDIAGQGNGKFEEFVSEITA